MKSLDLFETPCTIAYFGNPGAFSESAAIEFACAHDILNPCPRYENVFDAVKDGRADFGVLPIENSLAGSVHAGYDLLHRNDLLILGETFLKISHHLIAAPGVKLAQIRRAVSHPMALAQCEGFFQRNPQIEPVAVYDTAGAVSYVVCGNLDDAAAIGGFRAAALYGGNILAADIQDLSENYTRFVLIGRDTPVRRAAWGEERKTTILLTLRNRPGCLFEALRPFAERGINLTKIESRPIRGTKFEYMFYVDFVSRTDDRNVESAITALGNISTSMRFLGSYPVASGGRTLERRPDYVLCTGML